MDTNPLISLWWVSYEGSFQVCEGRWWKKIRECQKLKLGDASCTLKKYSRRLKRLSLGIPLHPLLHRQSSVCPSPHYIFITSCVMCYSWSVLHLISSLFYFFLLFITSRTLAYIVWERNTLHFTLEHNIGFMLIIVVCYLSFYSCYDA